MLINLSATCIQISSEMDMDVKNSVFGGWGWEGKKFNEIVIVKLDFCIRTYMHTRICTFIKVGKHYLNRVLKGNQKAYVL